MSTTATHDSGLPGVNVLLMGPAGTGKTHSLGTLVEAGIEVFYLGLESGLELAGYPLSGEMLRQLQEVYQLPLSVRLRKCMLK